MLTTDFIPAKEGGSRYLMIVMHGLGDSMEGYRPLVAELGITRMNYLLVNAPDHYVSGFSWYDIYGEPKPGIVRSRELLNQLLEHQRSEGFEYDHMFLFGFSQGCLMAVETGARFHSKLGGVIGISGYVQGPDELLAEKSPVAASQKFLITHGTQDSVIPFEGAKNIFARLAQGGLDINFVTFDKAHSFAGDSEFQLIRNFVEDQVND